MKNPVHHTLSCVLWLLLAIFIWAFYGVQALVGYAIVVMFLEIVLGCFFKE